MFFSFEIKYSKEIAEMLSSVSEEVLAIEPVYVKISEGGQQLGLAKVLSV